MRALYGINDKKELEKRDKEEAERQKKLKMEKEIDEGGAGLGDSWNWDDNLPF